MRRQIESIFAQFLWNGPELQKKLHAVSWEIFCKAYKEGGLNIQRVKDVNNARLMKHVWWIATNKESLYMWVRWVHEKYLKHNSVWTVGIPKDCS